MTSYQYGIVNGNKIFYREAGPKTAPAILLLHGFPTSSHMFRNLIPALADSYHVVAPDLLGFGFSDAPDRKQFRYTFERLAETIDNFTRTIGLDRYTIYVFDYGAPVGLRLALAHPERITAIISQNGNAYDEGLSQGWTRSRNTGRNQQQRIALRCANSLHQMRRSLNTFMASRTKHWWRPKPTPSTLHCWLGQATMRYSSTCFWTMPTTLRSIRSSRTFSARSVHRCSRCGARTTRSFCLPVPRRSGVTTRTLKCISMTLATSHSKPIIRKLQPPFVTFSTGSSTSDWERRKENWVTPKPMLYLEQINSGEFFL